MQRLIELWSFSQNRFENGNEPLKKKLKKWPWPLRNVWCNPLTTSGEREISSPIQELSIEPSTNLLLSLNRVWRHFFYCREPKNSFFPTKVDPQQPHISTRHVWTSGKRDSSSPWAELSNEPSPSSFWSVLVWYTDGVSVSYATFWSSNTETTCEFQYQRRWSRKIGPWFPKFQNIGQSWKNPA